MIEDGVALAWTPEDLRLMELPWLRSWFTFNILIDIPFT